MKIEASDIESVSVYNTLGEEIFSTSASGNSFEYDLGKYETGVYFIKVKTAEGVVTKRVTKK